MECGFCKKKGELSYDHVTTLDGAVVCPKLSEVICGCCGSTGVSAHTTKHCPHLKCRLCGGRHLDQYCRSKKTVKPDHPPPAGYVCKACNVEGHWIINCAKAKKVNKESKKEYPAPPDGYVCKACNESGHWIQQCTKDKDAPLPEGYVCRACNIEGHWIKHCPN